MEVDDMEQGPQDRALGHPGCDRGGLGREGIQLNELEYGCIDMN